MWHIFGLPNTEERHKIAQVKANLRVCADNHKPLFNKVGRKVKSRLKRGTEWMNQAATTISKSCNVREIMKDSQWVMWKAAMNDLQPCL